MATRLKPLVDLLQRWGLFDWAGQILWLHDVDTKQAFCKDQFS
jgi:hypothetical protein